MSSWGFTNDFNSFLGFLGLGLGFFFFRFLGLRLGLGLNKMNLAYVCIFWILYEILYYTWVLCICMYVQNSIFRMVLSTWLHTHFCVKVLIMYLHFPIFKLFPSSSPKLYLLHFMMSSQNKFLSQQLCKATPLTYGLESIWNFGETWTTMSTIIFQNFSSFNFMRDLATSLKSSQTGT